MKLAFYYHVSLAKKLQALYLPSYLGVFIDNMAEYVDELVLVMHEANDDEIKECDYQLTSKNISWINLGQRSAAWHRSIWHKKIIKPFAKEIDSCDAFIIRGPSPLAPYYHKYLNKVKIFFMVVGDYKEGAKQFKVNSVRDFVITMYLKHNDYLFRKQIAKTHTLVNSSQLYKSYSKFAKSTFQIRTTTLSKDDFFIRNNTCKDKTINLLYTGRIDKAKGIFELIDATEILLQYFNIHLNIVGWEINPGKKLESELLEIIKSKGISHAVTFHGKKSLGNELNFMYRMADIYLIPSYFEGFPRTIWEAMANSLPVIATNVGGIPDELKDEQDALLINPKSVYEIVSAVKKLINNSDLRKTLIKNGFELARKNTLEVQTMKIINIIKDNIKSIEK
jgi:glycosyltransferase involved in cell wall biosynthesis